MFGWTFDDQANAQLAVQSPSVWVQAAAAKCCVPGASANS